MKRVSVLDKGMELVLATDPLAQEVAIYEFQRWNEVDSTWIPLTPKYLRVWLPGQPHRPTQHRRIPIRHRAVAYNGCEAVVGESRKLRPSC